MVTNVLDYMYEGYGYGRHLRQLIGTSLAIKTAFLQKMQTSSRKFLSSFLRMVQTILT